MTSSQRKDAASTAASRVTTLLEEEVKNLTEELSQCQADKEFVWSLWKRLQVANPDVTQAVSLVVEREKQKSELKDRKVLEILKVKDDKIQALKQRTCGQQEEINNLVKRKIAVDEENVALKNELCILQQKFKDKIQELKDTEERALRKDEQSRLVIKNLEEENGGLSTRYADLLNNLEKLRKQEAQWRIEKSGIDAKIKNLETDLTEARGQMEVLHSRCNQLASQLNAKQTELTEKDLDMDRIRKELQELQNCYKQNTEHAAQQAELIQQLQALNMDTQKVLRTQEDAHTAETISYQKLYNELTVCFEKLKASEIQLRENQVSLQNQLLEKDNHICQLEEQIQQNHNSVSSLSSDIYPTQKKEDFHHCSSRKLEHLITPQKSEIKLLQEKLKRATHTLADHTLCNRDFLDCISARAVKKHKEPPVKRSRSLSPRSFLKESEELRKLKIAERKIENLEKALQLKIQENDELGQVHEKRRKRLQMLQTNYRAVKKQLKQWEEGYSKPGRSKSGKECSDPQHLCQEDSDATWNELAYFKRENKKLLIEKFNLEEEFDQMKIYTRRDKAAIQELSMCLQQKQEELLFGLGEENGVKSSTPKKNVKETSAQTLQKVLQLERRIKSFEKESRTMKEVNKVLIKDKSDLKALLKQHQEETEAKEKELETLLEKITELGKDKAELHLMIDGLEREVTSLKRQVAEADSLRNENEDLQSKVKQLQSSLDRAKRVGSAATGEAAHGQWRCKSATAKVKLKTGKKKSLVQHHQSLLNQSIKVTSSVFENFSKDGWEDMTESSDSEILTSEDLGDKTTRSIPLTDKNDQQDQKQEKNNKMPPDTVHLEGQSKLHHKKTLVSNLTDLQQEKSGLKGKLDHLTQSIKLREDPSPMTFGHSGTAPAIPLKNVDLEIKQLQCKLKTANNEITKHLSTIKMLKYEVQGKEEQLRERQEKISRMERDITMKRHLIDDWRLRMKVNQEKAKSFKEMIQTLEEKVKTLTEDCSNKKTSIDSLKQRLNVASKEKAQYEEMYRKAKQELEKKEIKLATLEGKMSEAECAMTELETAASQQLHGLARQSEQALEVVQKKLIMSNDKVEEFATFVKTLATELQHNVKEMRTHVRCIKKMQQNKGYGDGVSRESVHRAQHLAASILNISKSDLDDILDVGDEETEQIKMEYESDREWMGYIQKLIEGQFPFASYLMDGVLEKLNEQKKLAEEYSSLVKQTT
uniref:Centlein isoform X5 n=1 Tax=Pogona vitticeps TaxID=103695 RepID=A0A6J0U1M6_9SAUR